jgi:hypothetical protein
MRRVTANGAQPALNKVALVAVSESNEVFDRLKGVPTMNENSSLAAHAASTKACPMCGETILATAVKCKFCKSELRLLAATPYVDPGLGDQRQLRLVESPPVSAQEYEEISIGTVFGLGILTFGIYAVVKFYQTVRLYEKTVTRASNFATLFWLYFVVGPLVSWLLTMLAFPLGVIAGIVNATLGAFVLREALALRREVVAERGLTVKLRDPALQIGLFVAAIIPLLGIVTIILLTTFFFEDHNRVARAFQQPASS